MRNAISRVKTKTCKRCNIKILDEDIICASCKNELLSQHNSQINWKTAFEIEKISRYVIRNTSKDDPDETTSSY